MKKQRQFDFWFGIGFGVNTIITGGMRDNRTPMYFITKQYIFLFFMYCETTIHSTLPQKFKS